MTNLQDVIDYVTEQANRLGINEVLVADHDFDKSIPENMVFIFPKGAVVREGYRDFDVANMIFVPNLLFPIPDLVFRVSDGKIYCLGSPNDSIPFPDVYYSYYPADTI